MKRQNDLAKKKKYYKKNTDSISQQRKEKYAKNPEPKIKENFEYRKNNPDSERKRKKDYNSKNSEKNAKRQKMYDDEHREEIKERKDKYNAEHADEKRQKEAERRQKAKDSTTQEMRNSNFNKDIIHGINFACFSCQRKLFIKQVKILENQTLINLFTKVDNGFLRYEVGINLNDTQLILCHNCHKEISHKRLPRIHWSNGLKLDEVPEELDFKDLEQQLIARNLIFEKMKKLPTSRMDAHFDRVISVPIDYETVSKTVTLLPRHPNDANIVAMQLKRKLEMKNSHLSEYIRPKQLIKALEKLIALGNPHYQDIKIDENFMDNDNNLDDINDDEAAQEDGEAMDQDKASQTGNDLENENEIFEKIIAEIDEETLAQQLESENNKDKEVGEEENGNILPNVKEYQSKQDDFTCLMPGDLSVNASGKDKLKQHGTTNVKVAPGEGQVPTNICLIDLSRRQQPKI